MALDRDVTALPLACEHGIELLFDGEEFYCPTCVREEQDQEDWDTCHDRNRPRVDGLHAVTPAAFRDELIAMARSASMAVAA